MATASGAYATAATLKSLANISDSSDDTLIGLICDRVNQYIETVTGRVLAPVSSGTFYLDGDGSDRLYFPRGIRAVSALEIADLTGGTYVAETSTNYVIRPLDQDRLPGWPATWLVLSPTSTQHRFFPVGLSTVKMTATTGWAAIPDDVTHLALTVARRAWNARQAGDQNVMGVDELGRPNIARFFALPDFQVLESYRNTFVIA